MNDTDVTEALRAHVADGPPMRITSGDVIAAGRRSRHRRLLLGAGGAAGLLAAVVAVTTVAIAPRPGPSGHTVGESPPLTTCASLQPSPTARSAPPGVPARAAMDPGAEAAATRVSC